MLDQGHLHEGPRATSRGTAMVVLLVALGLLLPAIAAQADNGLVGQYFYNTALGNYIGSRVDPNINVNWGTTSGNMWQGSDNYSERWYGMLFIPQTTSTWALQASCDDGRRVYVDGALLANINTLGGSAGTSTQTGMTLAQGWHPVIFDHQENGGGSTAQFLWNGGSGTTYSVIPSGSFITPWYWGWESNLTMGWTQSNMTSVGAAGGFLVGTYSGAGDPMLWAPTGNYGNPYLRPGMNRYLVTAILLDWAGANEDFQLFFARRGEGLDEAKSVHFSVIADNAWHWYVVDMAQNGNWVGLANLGMVETFRLDPGPGGETAGRHVYIDAFYFYGSAHEVSSTRLDGTTITEAMTTARYNVHFSEPVLQVDANDFAITTTGGVTSTVTNVTGPTFDQTYNMSAVPSGWGIVGNAALNADGSIHLTENANGQQGSLIANAGTIPVMKAFRAQFNMRVDDGSGTPADGYSFEYGTLSGGSFGEAGEPGTTGLKVCFFDYSSGPGGRHLEIRYPDDTNRFNVAFPYDPGNHPGFRDDPQQDSTVLSWQQVVIVVRDDGHLDVFHDNKPVVSGLNLAQWSAWNPQSSWRMGVGGRTGGENERHYIDDLRIVNADYTVTVGNFGGSPQGTLRLDLVQDAGNPVIDWNGFTCIPATFTTGETYIVDRCQPIVITGNPTAQTAAYLADANFTVSVTGSSPVYTWKRSDAQPIANGAKYAGQGTATLTIHNSANPDAAVTYYCTVSNSCSSVDSTAAALTVTGDPHFTSNPSSTTVNYTQNAAFTANAVGSNFSYRWYKTGVGALSNGAKYSGVTTATLNVLNCGNPDEGTYYCVVTDNVYPSKTATSGTGQLTVTNDPRFTGNPSPTSVPYLSTASFTVVAQGSNYSLRWYKQGVGALSDGAKYSGATTATLQVLNCVNADQGNYYCVATDNVNPAKTATSGSAALTVTGDPQITGQPANTSVAAGETAIFTVGVAGSNYSLQWYMVGVGALSDGPKYSGATTATLNILSSGTPDVGDYYCVATDNAFPAKTATSNTAHLTITTADPYVFTDPSSTTVNYNTPALFTVVFHGSNFSVQWYKVGVGALSNGAKYSNVTTQTLTVNACANADEGDFYCVATDNVIPGNTATSGTAHLTVRDPVVQTNPSNAIAPFSTQATFTAAIQGSSYTLQWYKQGNPTPLSNGAKYSGVTTATLTISNCVNADEGGYYCQATANAPDGDVATTTAGTLTVVGDPNVLTSPSPISVNYGATATFSATVQGSNFTVAWFRSIDPVIPLPDGIGKYVYGSAGSTRSLEIYDCAQADEDTYFCKLTDNGNPAKNAQSTPAQLTVADPYISVQPAGANLYPTQAFTVQITATGTAPVTFQWKKNGGNIANATSASYSISSVEEVDQADYTCAVTGQDGVLTSSVAHLEVYDPPIITLQPVGRTVDPGVPVSFTVAATGTAPLSYQWRKNGSDIANATGTTYTITLPMTSDTGDYTCYVHNAAGDFPTPKRNPTSNIAYLKVNAPPVIITDPESATVDYGTLVTFSVVASGDPVPVYQWYKDGSPITNATNASYVIAAPANADEGFYSCDATNSAGYASSAAAELVVNDPVITLQPPAQLGLIAGQTGQLQVQASGSAALTYQWYKNGAPLSNGGHISGADTDTLTISNASPAGDAGDYYCVITGGDGATSTHCTVQVGDPAILTDPVSQTVNPGVAVNLFIVADGTPTLEYQWQKYNSGTSSWDDLGGATASAYDILSAQESDEGQYRCRVHNGAGDAFSGAATLSVNNPVVIQTQPQSRTVDPTDSVTFTVTATGTAPLSYQWSKYGSGPIAGKTNASFTISSVAAIDSGDYVCTVQNVVGSLDTDYAHLTVNSPPAISTPTDPYTETRNPGESVTFSVVATGSEPLSYQWRKDGGSISGATGASYTINAVAQTDEAVYTCFVSNSAGTKLGTNPTSPGATLVVNDPVEILTPAGPVSQTVNPADAVTFTVTFKGTAPFTYQWSKDGAPVQNGTVDALPYETAYSIGSAQESDQGVYVCNVSNVVNALDAPSFTLDVRDPPTFTHQPTSKVRNYGDTVTFNAPAVGFLPISYQWKLNGAIVSESSHVTGTTSATLSIFGTGAINDDEGIYTCVATNLAGTVTSDEATLEVHDPAITQQPTDHTVVVGQAIAFHVRAVGSGPTYQWYKDDVPLVDDTGGKILGSTMQDLNISDCQVADQGRYYCIVGGGPDPDIQSDTGILTVTDPGIVTHPADQTVNPGAEAAFNVEIDPASTPPITYQWFKGSDPLTDAPGKIAGALTDTLTISDCQESDEGQYHCQVTGVQVVDSNSATLTVNNPVVIQTVVVNPPSASVNPDDAFSLKVDLVAGYTEPVTYQWYKDGAPIPANPPFSGTQTDTLGCGSARVEDEGDYTVTVSNIVGPVTSTPVHITVGTAVTISGQPQDAMAYVGQNAQFSVAVTGGAGALHYQWYFDNAIKTPVPVGTDSNVLAVNLVTSADAGAYWCVITDLRGPNTSNSARLSVADHLLITQDPVGGDFSPGQPLTLSVTTTGGFLPLAYEWKKDGNIVGTDATLTIASLLEEDSGTYDVTVSDTNTDVVVSADAEVVVGKGVPVAGAIGLGLLILASALGGAAAIRRKN